MRLTEKAAAVLLAVRNHQDRATHDGGIGARAVADILFGNPHKAMRAGQYVGRLQREGWVQSRMQWYQGARGHQVYSHVEYFITAKGRKILLDSGRGPK